MPGSRCSKCGRIASTDIPFVGMVCEHCNDRLSSPLRLDGLVDGASVVQLAFGLQAEMMGRVGKLIRMAGEVCRDNVTQER